MYEEVRTKVQPSKWRDTQGFNQVLGKDGGQHGIRPDPDAVEAVLTWKSPKDGTLICELLQGVHQWLRGQGIPDATTNEAQRQEIHVEQRGGKSHSRDKERVVQAPVLGMPTEKGMYVLDTDASIVAISGVLHQEQEGNGNTVSRPIAYESKVLSDTEMMYVASKAEMFAVVTFVKKYRAYLAMSLQAASRQQGTQLAEDVLNGPELHWEVDSSPGRIQHDN